MKAVRVNEFTPDYCLTDPDTLDDWLIVIVTANEDIYNVYKEHPNVAIYNGKKFYKMSFSSDSFQINYREAKNRKYHERYA